MIAVLGEALVDLILTEKGVYQPHLGGSPFNVAIGLARQGVDVCYLSPFSDDAFGGQLKAALIKEGVKIPDSEPSRYPTSLALVTIDSQGAPTYRLYRKDIADTDISREQLMQRLPSDLKLLHTGSLAITPDQLPKIQSLLTLLKEAGVLISIDINIRLKAVTNEAAYISGVKSIIPLADIVKASDEDIAAMGMGDDIEQSAEFAFRQMNGGILVLTQGDEGALVFIREKRIAIPVGFAGKLVDTVGAGDTFHSAFLASLARSTDFKQSVSELPIATVAEAARYAAAAAAINVTRAGCSPPVRAEVERFLNTAPS